MIALWTVGVICVDTEGHVPSGASSGGIALKVVPTFATRSSDQMFHAIIRNRTQDPHRPIIGRSARSASTEANPVATCQAGPASYCVKVLRSVIKDNSQHCTGKSVGVLIVQAEAPVNLPGIPPKLESIEMAAAYSSLSFGIGYFGSSMDRPKLDQLLSGLATTLEADFSHVREATSTKQSRLMSCSAHAGESSVCYQLEL
ncbi:hypothetical protein Vadar_011393 [Vaccinium darrowii]|uniref:Uncharacterized protein n=1 Tax=Vaccinium darrowii TaxID=229202 RepID=A0ACB7YD68_9ERIC|nr:hypothetical protein Vadar_011393 [Vaccinium darrowii]